MGLGLAGGFAAGFAERSSQRMASEREQMWAEEQNMINTMLPIALKNRHERMMERKGMKDTFNQLKQYMSDDSAFSVMGQGVEFSKGFLEDIRKEQDRLGRVFKDENDLRESGMLEFKTTADLAGVRANYEKSGRTFDDFMNQYVGKPTADPSVNQNQIAEDLIRHYGKIPGFENTVKNSAYRKMAATMGISPEDVSSYVSGEFSFDKDDRVPADIPIARRRVDRSIYRKLKAEELAFIDKQRIAKMGGAAEMHRLQMEQIRAAIALDRSKIGEYTPRQIEQNKNLHKGPVIHAGKMISTAMGGRQKQTTNVQTGEVESVSLELIKGATDPRSKRFESKYTAGSQEHRDLTSIYNSSLLLSTQYMNDHIIDPANGNTVTSFTTRGASHVNSPEGIAWLLISSAAQLDAAIGPKITRHMDILQHVMNKDELNRMVKHYDETTLSINPDVNNSISSIRGTILGVMPNMVSSSEEPVIENSDDANIVATAEAVTTKTKAEEEEEARLTAAIQLEAENLARIGVQENNLTDQTIVDMVQNPYMLKKAIITVYPTVDESIINEVIADIDIGQYSEFKDSELNAMLPNIKDIIYSKMPKIIPVDIDEFTELADSAHDLYKALWWWADGKVVKDINSAESNVIVANEKQLSSDIEYPNNMESRDQMIKYGDEMITFVENSNIKVPDEWEEIKKRYELVRGKF